MAIGPKQADWVSRVLGVRVAAVSSPTATASGDTLDKARQAWLAARKRLDAEVEKLQSAIIGTYKERGLGPDLQRAYREQVATVLRALDQELSAALDAAATASEADRGRRVAAAREAIDDYKTFLSSDKLIKQLDENPFTGLRIGATLSATLTALDRAVV